MDAYISPSTLLSIDPGDSNYRCIVMALCLHYFFLAQFTWIMTQVIFIRTASNIYIYSIILILFTLLEAAALIEFFAKPQFGHMDL